MLPKTATRVEENTRQDVNARNRRLTLERLGRYAEKPDAEIRRRLTELDREWDVERALEANAAAAALLTLALGRFVNKRFYVLTAAVAGFLLQHALQGWCPPLPVLRAEGVRTTREIDAERRALLKLLESRGSPVSAAADPGPT
jgi:hypothetical protein